jgi:hypothetical protein
MTNTHYMLISYWTNSQLIHNIKWQAFVIDNDLKRLKRAMTQRNRPTIGPTSRRTSLRMDCKALRSHMRDMQAYQMELRTRCEDANWQPSELERRTDIVVHGNVPAIAA